MPVKEVADEIHERGNAQSSTKGKSEGEAQSVAVGHLDVAKSLVTPADS
jgi:hypothetical protein